MAESAAAPGDLRWLVTGALGQLGRDVSAVLAAMGVPADSLRAVSSAELDITDSAAVAAVVADFAPDVIVNCAAYTAVDAAETDVDRAFAVNATGPGLLASAAERVGAKLVHVSTDYVFAGDASVPYTPGSETGPTSAYGQTKLAGEQAVRELAPEHAFVVRTAWVYGAGGKNFVKTMAGLERSRDTVSVVDDQRGSPTWTRDLAAGLIELAVSGLPAGVYHCTNAGEVTWFGFTQEIFAEVGADPERVLPTTSADFVRPAPRPAYSVLSGQEWAAAGLTPLRRWQDALHAAIEAGLLADV